jgi:hypothetical protein
MSFSGNGRHDRLAEMVNTQLPPESCCAAPILCCSCFLV